jgi:hypothetical protein
MECVECLFKHACLLAVLMECVECLFKHACLLAVLMECVECLFINECLLVQEAQVVRPMTHSLPQQPSRPVAMATAKPVAKSTSK